MSTKWKHYTKRLREGALRDIWKETVWIYQYAKHYRKAMVFYTVLGLFGTVVGLLSSLISRDMVDIITGQKAGLLLKTFCLYIGFSIGNMIITQVSSYFSSKISISVDNELKSDIFDKMLMTDLESIQKYHTGDLLTRWSNDAHAISSGILNWIPSLIINIVRFASTLALVVYYDPIFALLALMGIPVTALMSKTLLKRMQNNNRRSAAMNAKLSGFNQEAFSNIQTIKAFDLLSLYSKHLKQLQQEYLNMKMDFQKLSILTSMIMSVVGLAVSYSCYGFGIYRVWSGAISYGTMTMFLSLSGTLTGTFNQLTSLVPAAISITTSAGRLMDILEMPKEDYSGSEEAREFLEKTRNCGVHVTFRNFSYTYHNGTNVFQNADFQAAPNEIIALVGPSGEGKTTFLRLALALLKPQAGKASLYNRKGDEQIAITPATRCFFSYVPQGNTMFSGTIADNMRNVKPDATDEEIIQALKASCAWEFVGQLPEGINSPIGERGIGFSEGQAQRLSIARALLRHAPVLLLDEATSALDAATERKVLHNIMSDPYPRTCIVTTHRESVLDMCSKVYAIDQKAFVLLDEEEIAKRF